MRQMSHLIEIEGTWRQNRGYLNHEFLAISTMAHIDERNFRSHYYEKVGFKGVEGKKSLEILLKEDPLDNDKLTTFCHRFPVPGIYRPFVWKIVLGVLPIHQSIHQFVLKQRREQYKDLHHALKVMRKIQDDTDLAICHRMMCQLSAGKLPLEESEDFLHPDYSDFDAMANSMIEIVDDEIDGYWLSVMFFKHMEKNKESINKLNEKFEFYLKKEDSKLYNYLLERDLLSRLPYRLWFQQCFAVVFPVPCLARYHRIMLTLSSQRALNCGKNMAVFLSQMSRGHPF
ncbi:TBC1 domain family member 7-like isoform X2 [Ptychodera flava]|uniref:TBC1 domain family member 7-like isoform X2 n=1 Tax=Ptychodera flava TaxID=63121 RepID=UPI00396A3C04